MEKVENEKDFHFSSVCQEGESPNKYLKNRNFTVIVNITSASQTRVAFIEVMRFHKT